MPKTAAKTNKKSKTPKKINKKGAAAIKKAPKGPPTKTKKKQAAKPKLFRPTLYFAASLYNTRECIFNIDLAQYIQKRGYKLMVPQRDGFEFNVPWQQAIL